MRPLSSLFLVAAIVCPVVPEAGHALTPPIPPLSGTYHVQPGGVVLACGGFSGQCRTFTLEGTIELFSTFIEVRIARTDLRLRDDDGAFAFPGANDLQLTGLEAPIVIEDQTHVIEFAAEGEHGQSLALELRGVGTIPNLIGNVRLALRGTYNEGCCDRFTYEFGNVRLEPDVIDGLAMGTQEDPRFVINVLWGNGITEARASHERLGTSHGYFWFYTPDNPEIFVKIVSACETPFQRVWFFASGLTNQAIEIEVLDRWTFQTKTYLSPAGTAFLPIQDTSGFPCQIPVS